MINTEKESIAITWCDNGLVDGKFTEGLCKLLLDENKSFNFKDFLRINGNQISRQREVLLNLWENDIKTDWILCVDSDIVLTTSAVETLVNCADKDTHPVVSGVYFISYENEQTLMEPRPSIFMDNGVGQLDNIHPIPMNKLIKIDCAGLGFILIHKGVIEKLRSKYKSQALYSESYSHNKDLKKVEFVGEDISFFRKIKEIGVPVYAHTGANVQHIKRFSYDINYYAMYWDNTNKIHKQGNN